MLKNIAKGIGYPLVGSIIGLVTGVASSFFYIVGRIFLNMPDSKPQVDVYFDTKNLDMNYLEECFQNQNPHCNLPIGVDFELDNWTHPIVYTTTAVAGVGLLSGVGLYLYQKLKQQNKRKVYSHLEDEYLPIPGYSEIPLSDSSNKSCC